MNEGGGLQGLAGLVGHPGRREPPQLVVDERQQVGRGLRSPAAAASRSSVTSDISIV